MNSNEKNEVVGQVIEILKNDEAFSRKIKRIHHYYPNVKSEHRYRDALLECLNDRFEGTGKSLRAYAEVKNIDLVILDQNAAITSIEDCVKIQLKYQFPFDMIKDTTEGNDVRTKIHTDMSERQESNGYHKTCDLFVLIIHELGNSNMQTLPEFVKKGFHQEHRRLMSSAKLNEEFKQFKNGFVGTTENAFKFLKLEPEVVLGREKHGIIEKFPIESSTIFTVDFTNLSNLTK